MSTCAGYSVCMCVMYVTYICTFDRVTELHKKILMNGEMSDDIRGCSLPTLQLVQASEQGTTYGGDLLPALPVLQLRVELRGHQVVNLLDHHIHLRQDLLTGV